MSAWYENALTGLEFIGNVVDTPWAMGRAALAGKNPLTGIFEPEKRTSGRDMLESWGVLDENQEGLDAGDVAGFAVEMLDPISLALGTWGPKALKAAKAAKIAKTAEETKALATMGGEATKAIAPWAKAQRAVQGASEVAPEVAETSRALGPLHTPFMPTMAAAAEPLDIPAPELMASMNRSPIPRLPEPPSVTLGNGNKLLLDTDDPIVSSGGYDVHRIGSPDMAESFTALPKGYPIPKFNTSEEAQKAIDEATEQLIAKYGEREGLHPLTHVERMFGLPQSSTREYLGLSPKSPMTADELSHIRSLRVAHDAIEHNTYKELSSQMSEFLGDKYKLPDEIISPIVDQAAKLNYSNLRNNRMWNMDDSDELAGAIYNRLTKHEMPTAVLFPSYHEVLYGSGLPKDMLGTNPDVYMKKTADIVLHLLGPERVPEHLMRYLTGS